MNPLKKCQLREEDRDMWGMGCAPAHHIHLLSTRGWFFQCTPSMFSTKRNYRGNGAGSV